MFGLLDNILWFIHSLLFTFAEDPSLTAPGRRDRGPGLWPCYSKLNSPLAYQAFPLPSYDALSMLCASACIPGSPFPARTVMHSTSRPGNGPRDPAISEYGPCWYILFLLAVVQSQFPASEPVLEGQMPFPYSCYEPAVRQVPLCRRLASLSSRLVISVSSKSSSSCLVWLLKSISCFTA